MEPGKAGQMHSNNDSGTGGQENTQDKAAHSNAQHRRTGQTDLNHKLKQPKTNSRPSSSQQRQTLVRSRSRSLLNTWKSTNPFINFMQDFRKEHTGIKSTQVFRMGGGQWRKMSQDEKQPYVDAANNIKKQNQKANTNQLEKKSVPNNSQSKSVKQNKPRTRMEQLTQKQNQIRKQDEKKQETSDSESDTGTSETARTVTNDDSENTFRDSD